MALDETRTFACVTVAVAAAFAAMAGDPAESGANTEAEGMDISPPPTGLPEVDGAAHIDGPTDKKLHKLRASGTLLWIAKCSGTLDPGMGMGTSW